MNEFVKGILAAMIPALVVSVVAAWLTVQFSLKQFRSQKWWEKKAEAYSQVMEQLSYLQYYYNEWIDEDLGTKTLTDEQRKDLADRQAKARESIARAAAIGSYAISDNAAAALTKLLYGFYKTEGATSRYEFVQECIGVIREEAKNDLARN